MPGLFVGIDLGSSSTKALLLNPDSGVLKSLSEPVDQFSPFPGWSEADPGQWWEAVCHLLPRLLAGTNPADVRGVAVTGMVPAVLLLGDNGRPLRRAILQNDARAGDQIGALQTALTSVDLLARTGSALTQQSVAPTLAWTAEHEPAIWEASAHVVGSYDWLAHQLGADLHVETNWALESGLFDLTTLSPVPEVLTAAGIPADMLPPVTHTGDQLGAVTAAAATATGLPPGTPVYAGGADHVLSAAAAGLAHPGDWLVKLGGAGDILTVSSSPVLDARLYLDTHPTIGTWLPNGCMATSGTLLRWVQDITGSASIDTLETEAAAAEPAALLCLPYFLGEKSPLHDPSLRGAFLGLHLGSQRADLYRAALEAVAYGFRQHVDVFTELGVPLDVARVSNGGSRSRVWKQILSDALSVPLWPVLDHPGASLGAAYAAAVGAGATDWTTAAAATRLGEPVTPNPHLKDRYADAYDLYQQAGAALTPVSHRLSNRATP